VTPELRCGGLVALLLVLGGSAPPVSAQEASRYFPPALSGKTYECVMGGQSFKTEILNDFEVEWFAGQLDAADEPPLAATSDRAVLRFTWLRSFDPAVTVRIEGLDQERPVLIAKRLPGADGEVRGGIDKTVERPLTLDEAAGLARLLRDINLPEVAATDCNIGLDGAEWLVETADPTGYRFYKRRSPEHGEIRKLGLFLLHLTGWNNRPIY
jgi:hypothetical protein